MTYRTEVDGGEVGGLPRGGQLSDLSTFRAEMVNFWEKLTYRAEVYGGEVGGLPRGDRVGFAHVILRAP